MSKHLRRSGRIRFLKAARPALIMLLFSFMACKEQVSRRGAAQELQPGRPAPSFELVDLEGNTRSLKDYQGKVILLNFWATWCAPCVAEMPAIERLAKKYEDQGFVVVAINHDPPDSLEKVKSFVKEKGLSFDILLDPELALPPKYGVTGFPETFFIGPEGEFLSFFDSKTNKELVRILAERPWDSPIYAEAVGKLLSENLK